MHKNLIGGEWVAGNKSQPNINPADTRDVIGEYAQANVEQARHAIGLLRTPSVRGRSPRLSSDLTSSKRLPHAGRHGDGHLPTAGVDCHVPFGGRKGSSYGPREQGRYAAEFYTTVKTAYTNA